MTPIERRRLEVLHGRMEEMAKKKDIAAYTDANTEFHSTIYVGSHNPFLIEMATTLRRRLLPFRRAQFRSAGRLKRSHAEHDLVVKAIMKGDATAAHAAMLKHVSLIEEAFEKLAADVSQPAAKVSRRRG